MSTLVVELVELYCGGCGVHFGLERRYKEERIKDGQTFRCPNGCVRVYADTEAKRLKRKLEATEAQRAEQAERERDEARAKVERLQRFVDAFDATDYAAISRELAETPAGNVHHGKETQSVRALGIARAALEDSK